EVVDSREVETVWHNFDALNQPLTHPTRSHRDTFYVDDQTLLRTHTSTGQIRVMESRKPPIYIATLGRTYRRDTPSPRSTPNFHQVEALAVDPAGFENGGYDPDEWSGFAWGLGIDRIAAQRHGIPDIRMFWENDLRVLRQF